MEKVMDQTLELIQQKQRAEVAQHPVNVAEVAAVVTDIDTDPKMAERVEQAVEVVKQRAKTRRRSEQGTRNNRATFIVDPLLVARLKVVAAMEGVTYKRVVERALTSFLKTWQINHAYVDLERVMFNYKDE